MLINYFDTVQYIGKQRWRWSGCEDSQADLGLSCWQDIMSHLSHCLSIIFYDYSMLQKAKTMLWGIIGNFLSSIKDDRYISRFPWVLQFRKSRFQKSIENSHQIWNTCVGKFNKRVRALHFLHTFAKQWLSIRRLIRVIASSSIGSQIFKLSLECDCVDWSQSSLHAQTLRKCTKA